MGKDCDEKKGKKEEKGNNQKIGNGEKKIFLKGKNVSC